MISLYSSPFNLYSPGITNLPRPQRFKTNGATAISPLNHYSPGATRPIEIQGS